MNFFRCFKKAPVFVLFLSAGLICTSCGIFETRDAEPPDDGAGGSFQQPDRAELVISNLQNAVQSLSTVNYMRCLNDEEFEFLPSQTGQENYPDVWSGWSLQDEENYFNNLRAAAQAFSGHSLQIEDMQSTSISDNLEQISATYTLTVIHGADGDIPTVARGNFVMDLERGEDGLWTIIGWSDNSGGSSFSWSDFKAEFGRD